MNKKAGDHFVVSEDWLAQRREDILMPELPIIDPHHHLWSRPEIRYLLPELQHDLASGHNVRATVYLEAWQGYHETGPEHLRPVGETEFAAQVAEDCQANDPFGPQACAGIVGYVDLTSGSLVDETLKAHITAGKGRFRGVRGSAHWDPYGMTVGKLAPAKGLLLESVFRDGFARIHPMGLTYDAWQFHHQLLELANLAGSFPETTIIVNHVGAPLLGGPYKSKRAEVFSEWTKGIQSLSKHSNVFMKLGGFGSERSGFDFASQNVPPSSEELAAAIKPFIETCIESFGARRCMFESNFPPDKQSYSYATVWNAFKRLAANASTTEQHELFFGTASRVYKISA